MRLGLISDVHGNKYALTAAVTSLRRRGVDAWVSAGDLIGYGPHPNECVELVADLGATGVAGNHELIALGRLPGARSSCRAQQSHGWTREVLRDDVIQYLSGLPLRVDLGSVVVTHGSLEDPEEYVSTAARASDQLLRLRRDHPAARWLMLGNTHRQLLVGEFARSVQIRMGVATAPAAHERYVVNPGSVGQSRQWEWPPRARAAVLDVDEGTVIFESVSYDVRACRRALRGAGLPYRAIHSPPQVRSVVKRRMRRLSARPDRASRSAPRSEGGAASASATDRGEKFRAAE